MDEERKHNEIDQIKKENFDLRRIKSQDKSGKEKGIVFVKPKKEETDPEILKSMLEIESLLNNVSVEDRKQIESVLAENLGFKNGLNLNLFSENASFLKEQQV